MKGRNITEHRSDKRKNFPSAKEKRKARIYSPLSSGTAKEMQIIRQSRKCHIFVRTNANTACLFVILSITTKTISMGQHQCPKYE